MRKVLMVLIVATALMMLFGACTFKQPEEPEPGPEKAYLANILIDGKPIEGFQPQKYSYTYILNSAEDMPIVTPVTRNYTDMTRVLMPAELPGSATIEVTPMVSEGVQYETVIYRIFFVVLK